jgi:hypothetical protein
MNANVTINSNQINNKGSVNNRFMLFYNMIRRDYVGIHGDGIVSKLFHDLTVDDLDSLIVLYKEFPLLRWNKFSVYLEKNDLIPNGFNASFVIHMYINAIQHFLDR